VLVRIHRSFIVHCDVDRQDQLPIFAGPGKNSYYDPELEERLMARMRIVNRLIRTVTAAAFRRASATDLGSPSAPSLALAEDPRSAVPTAYDFDRVLGGTGTRRRDVDADERGGFHERLLALAQDDALGLIAFVDEEVFLGDEDSGSPDRGIACSRIVSFRPSPGWRSASVA
jgi:hypothetical protein